jgi:hypothetical protein
MSHVEPKSMAPEGYFPNVNAEQPCFQKYEIRVEAAGRKYSVCQLTWYPTGKHFDQLWSFHSTQEEADASRTKQECARDGRPLPPGRYQMSYFNGKNAEGLAESSARIYAKKNKAEYAEEGHIAEVVPDKYNPRKFAVRGMLVVS